VEYAGARQIGDFFKIHVSMWAEHLKDLIKDSCYPQYGTISDGTPCFASAEGLKVRLVTYDWWIIEPLLSVKLLKKSPNGESLAKLFEGELKEFGLSPNMFRVAMKGRHHTASVLLFYTGLSHIDISYCALPY